MSLLLKQLSTLVPFDGRWKVILSLIFVFVLFSPITPSCVTFIYDRWNNMPLSQYASPESREIYFWISWCIFLLPVIVLFAKFLYPSKKALIPQPPREVTIGDMTFSESALFTNIMITGAIGSGKTSSAIYPILDQICKIYNVWDEKTEADNPYKKWGGLVMDVKGDFYEALICLLHWSGRNVLEDLVVITPFADYAYAEMIDPDTKLYWYICLRGGSSPSSLEFNDLTKRYTQPNSKFPIPIEWFSEVEHQNEKIPGTGMTKLEFVRSLDFFPTSKTNFIGWRNYGDDNLIRIARTDHNLKEILLLDENGKPIIVKRPKKLRYLRTRSVNNGLTFNIAPPSLGHIELANRLVAMSKNASGKTGGGDNSYWDDATKKHIQWVIYMLRTINPDKEVTALDINAHTVSPNTIKASVNKLSTIISDLETKKLDPELTANERNNIAAKITILSDVREYFNEEWNQLDQRTKSNLVSTITNVFAAFLPDPRLRTVFCSSTAVSLEEIMQSGKIYTLVAPKYESAARIFGTSLKMEFQAILRRRTASAEYDKTRFIAFICDEVQNFVTTGGNDPTSGDESFMALSRQSKVCNVVATQADTSIVNVVGDKSAEVYYAQFGSRIWYQNTDQKTNERAAKILGKIKREKLSTSGQDVSVTGLLGKDGGKGYNENISYESKEKYPPEAFSNLNVHQCIIYNKSKKGKRSKSCKCQLKPHYIGAPSMEEEKAKVLRWYFRAYIENRLFELHDTALINHTKVDGSHAVDMRVQLPKETAVVNTDILGVNPEVLDNTKFIPFTSGGNDSTAVTEDLADNKESDTTSAQPVPDPVSVPDYGLSVGKIISGSVYPSQDSIVDDEDISEPVYGDSIYKMFQEIDRGEMTPPLVTGRTPEGQILLSDEVNIDTDPERAKEMARARVTELDTRMSRGLAPEQNLTNLTLQDPVPVTKTEDLIDGSDSVMSNIVEGELPVVRSTLSVVEQERMLEIFNPGHPNEDFDSHSRIVSSNWAKWQFQKRIPIFDELFSDNLPESPTITTPPLESSTSYELPSSISKEMDESNTLPDAVSAVKSEDLSPSNIDTRHTGETTEEDSTYFDNGAHVRARSGSFRRRRPLPPKPSEPNVTLDKALNNE